jgi:putative ABC transport system ATP-binding protein
VPLFDIRELTKTYTMGEVEVHALRQVALTLDEGQFVVLLGPSGSGKSTLLNILGGLDVPTSGQVFYRDTELTRRRGGADRVSPAQRRVRVSVLQPHSQPHRGGERRARDGDFGGSDAAAGGASPRPRH